MTGIVDGEQLRLLIRKTLCWKQICRFSFSGRVRLTAFRYKNKWDKILESLNFWHSLHCSIYKPTWNKNIKKHVALKSHRRDFFFLFFFKYSFSRVMSIDGTLSSKSARITINWRIKRCLSVASPQTSFGFFCHAFISPLWGRKWMRDKRTPKDVFGEASLSDLPKILSCTERDQGWNRDGDEIASSKRIHTM